MSARFEPSPYPGGRILMLSGAVPVGVVFPPGAATGAWRWRLWVLDSHIPAEGAARTEGAAKNALLGRWRTFLDQAALIEVPR